MRELIKEEPIEFFYQNKFYYKNSDESIKDRTKERLIEIQNLGMIEVGYGEFGLKNIMSGLYIEKVWNLNTEHWQNYIKWVKELIDENQKGNAGTN